jgi:hypothetical protein
MKTTSSIHIGLKNKNMLGLHVVIVSHWDLSSYKQDLSLQVTDYTA